MTNIKVITKTGKKKDGTEFTAYKLVNERGKLIDLHFKNEYYKANEL